MVQNRVDPRIVDRRDDCVHLQYDRRRFLKGAARLLGSAASAVTLLPVLNPNDACAALVAESDPRIRVERLKIAGASGSLQTYFVNPTAPVRLGSRRASILVAHRHRGLDPQIEDVVRRLATEGYIALAVDFLSPFGGTPSDEAAARELFAKLDPARVTADAHAAIAFLRKQGDPNGKVGAVGFSWGGGVINRVAAKPALMRGANLDAGVVYDGPPPPLDWVPKIKVPLLLNYADPQRDTLLGAMLPSYEEALKASKVDYRLYIYEGANHAFADDSQSARYDETAASLAWSRTLAFFKTYLS